MGSIIGLILLALCVSQVYWFGRIGAGIGASVRGKRARLAAGGGAAAAYLLALAYNAGWIGGRTTPLRLTPGEIFLGAPFTVWLASSLVSFFLVALFWSAVFLVRAPARMARKLRAPSGPPEIESPPRRVFLKRTANTVVAVPFVGGVYGLLYGRLNLETTRQPIRLARLPKAFDGFRIAQLSDIHIGPFMTPRQIRAFVGIANALHPDLTVLTGDFVTFDPSTQGAVVEALSGLKAPFGVFGCLGNHDAWAGVEDSITLLFAKAGIRILRHERVPIRVQGEALNLMGIDFASRRLMGPGSAPFVRRFLAGLDDLVDRGRVNIFLSHNPDTFDRAAELGIDLSLAGHTHGGQASLEFISPQMAPARLVTPYVAGWFGKPGGQLYVNRGIGTIGAPIRIGAPPEITLYELKAESS
ncbi:MAG: metallophosphoesterase [Bryobacteraceae bacterium]|jgi:predicted MPP superfamily phosphohydrolase